MILYGNTNKKIQCIKCNQPKLNNKNGCFDFFESFIDNTKVTMYFAIRNNVGNLYFKLNNQWYKTSIITNSGFDVFEYLHENKEKLYMNKNVLDVFYCVSDCDNSIWVTEKSYFDKNHCLQDNDTDDNYIQIENAMNRAGYPRLMESNYEYMEEIFNSELFEKKLSKFGLNMIYNSALNEDE